VLKLRDAAYGPIYAALAGTNCSAAHSAYGRDQFRLSHRGNCRGGNRNILDRRRVGRRAKLLDAFYDQAITWDLQGWITMVNAAGTRNVCHAREAILLRRRISCGLSMPSPN
jgi:hypothetical protein